MDIAEAKAAAPVVPGNTCPIIDRLSTYVDAIAADLELVEDSVADCKSKLLAERDTLGDVVNARMGLQRIRKELETLRQANEALRESGRYWYQVAKAAA